MGSLSGESREQLKFTFKSQKILCQSTRFKFNPQEIKYISASNIRSTLPSYMIYFIFLLSSHPLWAPPPRASRGSAIHVFLVRLIGRAQHRYSRDQGFEWSNPVKAWIFFRLFFSNCISCVYNCDDHASNNSALLSSHIWFSCTHIFKIIIVIIAMIMIITIIILTKRVSNLVALGTRVHHVNRPWS